MSLSVLEPVFSVALHPKNLILAATGGSDDRSYLWSMESGEKILDLAVHADSCSAVAFSNDGKYVASGGMDVRTIGVSLFFMLCRENYSYIMWKMKFIKQV